MGKKLIYLLLAVFLGGFIVLQSCNESPMVTNNYGEDPEQMQYGTIKGEPRLFGYQGTGKPTLCGGTTKLEIWGGGGNVYGGYIEFDGVINSTLSGTFYFESPEIVPWNIGSVRMSVVDNLANFNPHHSTWYLIKGENLPYTEPTLPFTYPNMPVDAAGDGWYMAIKVDMDLYGGPDGFEFYLPNGVVQYDLQRNYSGGYFEIHFDEGEAGWLAEYDPPNAPQGTYYGWCIDKDKLADLGDNKCGLIYSSYEDLPSGILGTLGIENPQNLDMVNYIINTYHVGSGNNFQGYSNTGAQTWPFGFSGNTAPGTFMPAGGTITELTVADIQNAIWSLVDELPPAGGWMNPQNPAAVWGIIYDAMTKYNTENLTFWPQCNQTIVGVLVPVDCENPVPNFNNAQFFTFQPMIFDIIMPCRNLDETAFADGKDGGAYPGGHPNLRIFKWDPDCYTPPPLPLK